MKTLLLKIAMITSGVIALIFIALAFTEPIAYSLGYIPTSGGIIIGSFFFSISGGLLLILAAAEAEGENEE